MGKVVASFKVFPEDVNVNLEEIKRKIEKKLPPETSIHKFEEEPVAFGLKVIIAHIILPEDVGGEMDKIENILGEIEGISQVQFLMVRRI
ncbi:MAG: elongation factor 1-beta [Candidatus Bathyarchaeota archaeon]|nr:elongation factor 1-beta [Candidatus Bathyarchaeota archaeon]